MKYIIGIFILFLPLLGFAQAAWIEPGGDDFNPDDSVTIYVDLAQTSNDFGIVEAAQSGEDMFIWTWMPNEHPAGHPLVNGIGDQAWKNSNEALKMTKEADLLYSYKMVPTAFYEVSAAEVYDNDFSLLVKPKDGGGFGDPDIKTEDLMIIVDPPGLRKVMSIPEGVLRTDTFALPISADDLLTIRYDFNQEENPNLLAATDFYVYLRGVGSDGNNYQVTSLAQVDETDSVRMRQNPDGAYTLSFIPNDLFDVPPGVSMSFIRYQIVRDNFSNTNDIVSIGAESEFRHIFLCD